MATQMTVRRAVRRGRGGERGNRPARRVPARYLPVAIVAAALALAAIGLTLTRAERSGGATGSPVSATLGGITTQLSTPGWVNVDHTMMPGFQMPAQMMPGMPAEGDARLAVPMTLWNSGGDTGTFDVESEFVLGGGAEDTPRTPQSDTFGEATRLAAGNAMNGILYFDTKPPGPQDPPLYLEWRRAGQSVRLTLPFGGAAPPSHQH